LDGWNPIPQAHIPHARLRGTLIGAAYSIALAALWAMLHPYRGFAHDAQLYAMQALARLHPTLATDLFLHNESQDRFTVFSPLYAALIGAWGLWNAALVLNVIATLSLVAGVWCLAGRLIDRDAAFFTAALLILTKGPYGAGGVFQIVEDFLTARPFAEALVVIALTVHFAGHRRVALGIAAAALCIHPIMALPGLMLLILLRLPLRASLAACAAGIFAVVALALAAQRMPSTAGLLAVMDPAWQEVVRERAQFLFLPLWTADDWSVNLRPFLSLAASLAILTDGRMRKLAAAAMLVSAAGLAIAYAGSAIGPLVLILQGQAWRWVWITGLVAIVLVVPTVARAWRDERCGPLCAVLLVCAWTFEPLPYWAGTLLPLLLWMVRDRIDWRVARVLRWAALAAGITVLIWAVANAYLAMSASLGESGRRLALTVRLGNVLGLGVTAVSAALAARFWFERTRSAWIPGLAAAVLLALLVTVLPGTFRQTTRLGSQDDIAEFTDWRDRIPPTSTVVVDPPLDSGAFVWFTLLRPNYLSPATSAGVVFSRRTALEVRRRGEVLLPVQDPVYKILTARTRSEHGEKEPPPRPLTAANLALICKDPDLGFVIGRDSVGFDAVRHTHDGAWKNWNLYDCSRVRAVTAAR
jgi:hypothetical protein